MLSLCHLENTALQLRLPRLQKLPNGGTGMRIAAAQSDAINRVAFRSSKRSRASSGVPGNSQMTEVELDARNWRTTWELWQIGVSFVAQVFDSDLAGEEPVCSQIPQE